MGFLSDESGSSVGLGLLSLGLCAYSRNVDVAGTMAATYSPTLTFAGVGDISPGGNLAATYTPTLTFAGVGTIAVEGTMAATYTPTLTFAGTGTAADVTSGTMAATYSPTLTFAGTGELERAVIDTFGFTDNNDGTPAQLDLTYSGFITGYRVYIATGGASISVTDAQLYAGSGGTDTDEFTDVEVGSAVSVTGLTSASEASTRIAAALIRSADGSLPSNVEVATVSGLDFTVPAAPTWATNAAGTQYIATFAETVYFSEDTADWTFGGVTAGTPTVVSVTGSGTSTLTVTVSTNLPVDTDTLTISYTNTDSDIRDADANLLADIVAASVTNNVAPTFSVEVLPLTTTMITDPTTATFSAENLVGAGNIMVFPYTWDGFGRTLNTVTIDGVSASAITDGVVTTTYTLPGTAGVAGYEADVTDATGDLVFTFSDLVNRCGVQGIRMVDGQIHDVRYVTSASTVALTSDVDVVSGGALFAFAVARNFNSGTNSFTNMTPTTGPTAINNDSEILLALETGISTTETRSITCDLDASSDKQMILVSMEPA